VPQHAALLGPRGRALVDGAVHLNVVIGQGGPTGARARHGAGQRGNTSALNAPKKGIGASADNSIGRDVEGAAHRAGTKPSRTCRGQWQQYLPLAQHFRSGVPM
jgi:hypothetical protein